VNTSAATLLAIVAGVVGVFIGWYSRSARGAHGDLKVYKGRIPGLRRARNRSGLWAVALVVISLLVLSALVRGS
jgi:hypothetical protein